MKKFFLWVIFVLISLFFCLNASAEVKLNTAAENSKNAIASASDFKEANDENDGVDSADDDYIDDIDSLFDDAEDVTAEENNKKNSSQQPQTEVAFINPYTNFKFSGTLKSEMGLIYGHRFGDLTEKYYDTTCDAYTSALAANDGEVPVNRRNWMAGYFDFENSASFVARPDESFAIHGTLCTTFFPIDWINESKSMLYFDYMAGPYCLVSAGKKTLNWGYVRIFNNVTDYSQEERLTTNIVADSETSIIGSLTFPFSHVTATGVILYNENSGFEFSKEDPPKVDELSYAGSIEFSFWQASLNLYGRRTAKDVSSVTDKNPYGINNVIGMEIKRTFFNYDCYVQNTLRIAGKTDFYREAEIITLGTYRVWDRWGFNVEFQNVKKIEEATNSQRFALDIGVKNVGPKKDLKLVSQWRHDSNEYSSTGAFLDNCWVKIGLVKSNFTKHLDWNNGVQIFYKWHDNRPEIYQARIASYFTLNVGY